MRGTALALVTVVALATPLAGPSVSLAASGTSGPDPTPSSTSAASLEAAATAMQARVATLTQEYVRRAAAVSQAADELAAAFSISAQAEGNRDDADAALRHAKGLRAAQVQALYSEGAVGLALSVLGAQTPDDALWQLSTGDYLRAQLLRSANRELLRVSVRADLAARRSDVADDAGTRVSAALGDLQETSAAAHRALALAQAELETLRRTAGDARAAEAAAAALAQAQAAAEAARLAAGGSVTALGIPATYEQTYRAAAQSCPGLRWTLLAAVGQVESGHGRNNGPSSAGAVGPMQFMPATFAIYGVDGDHDGRIDPWSYPDAIWAAARYLCVSGAEGGGADGVQKALFTYNHAQWYVDLVLGAERAIVERQASTGSTVGASDGGTGARNGAQKPPVPSGSATPEASRAGAS